MPKKLTTEDFVRRSRIVHGLKYIYDDVVYQHTKGPVKIICPKHGSFLQAPNSHLSGRGCDSCGRERTTESSRKYSHDFVQEFFEKNGCKLISKFLSVHKKVRYTCVCGRNATTTFSEFRKGHRCKSCGIKKAASSNTFSKKNVEEVFHSAGCHLLSEYRGIFEKLTFRCHCGMTEETTFQLFKKRRHLGCTSCSNRAPVTIARIKDLADAAGAILLSKKYRCGSRIHFQCKCGMSFYRGWETLRSCKKLTCDSCSGVHSPNQTEVQSFFEEAGCRLLTRYMGANTRLRFICKCGRPSSVISLRKFKADPICNKCKKERFVESQLLDFAHVNAAFKKAGLILLETKYSGSYHRMKYVCHCGRTARINWQQFRSGKRCKDCGYQRNKRTGSEHYRWNPDRETVQLKKTIRARCSNLLRRCLSLSGIRKSTKTEVLLGYSRDDLFHRITNHPNWQNISNGVWHIDHIFPVNAFLKIGILEVDVINDLSNLQPLSGVENIKKSDTYDHNEFTHYLQQRYGKRWLRDRMKKLSNA